MDEGELRRAAELCERAGVWLVMDNTYEHFVYGGRQHVCIPGPHILHLFSFSKVRSCAGSGRQTEGMDLAPQVHGVNQCVFSSHSGTCQYIKGRICERRAGFTGPGPLTWRATSTAS